MSQFEELPEYRCHKIVRAARIMNVLDILADESCRLVVAVPNEPSFTITTNAGWWGRNGMAYNRNEARSGDRGYFVVYNDGFQSWSPTPAFAEGYWPIDEEPPADEEPGNAFGRGDAPPPLTVSNCHFVSDGDNGVEAIANALRANAEALETLAEKVGHGAPMLQIGGGNES